MIRYYKHMVVPFHRMQYLQLVFFVVLLQWYGTTTFSYGFSCPSFILSTSRSNHHNLYRKLRYHNNNLKDMKPCCDSVVHTVPSTLITLKQQPYRSIATQLYFGSNSYRLPIIAANDVWGNWAVLTGIAALAQVMGQKTMIGKLLGPPVTAMALSFVAATIGILCPGGTIAAKSLQLFTLQYATPLILLGADFRDATARCGPLLLSFTAAAISTIMACFVGWLIAGQALHTSLGRDGLVIAAALLAKNVGGGINYLAICRTLQASPTAVAAGLCVDNLFALVYFPMTSIFANGRPDVITDPIDDNATSNETNSGIINNTNDGSVQQISFALFLSTVLLWLGEKIGRESGNLPACTVLTVLFARCAPKSWITPILQRTSNNLGLVALYLFFATAGAPGMSVADSVRSSLVPLGLFLSSLYMIHGALLCLLYKIFGSTQFGGAFQPQRLLVSSSAAIGGPATAVALATEAKWTSLMVPSLIVGNIGYAIATFCGLGFYTLLK